jgi:multidrug resistance efflux pump
MMEDLMKMMIKRVSFISVLCLVLIGLVSCDAVSGTQDEGLIEASGVVEAVEVAVAPEVSGKVVDLFVAEGDEVALGDEIMLIESEILQAQYDQVSAGYVATQATFETAEAALASAEAGLDVATLNLEMAKVQYDLTLQLARFQQYPERIDSWSADAPNEFELPVWYFDDAEEISAAEMELDAAWETLELERANLEDVIASVSNADLEAAEERLAQAQAAFLVVEELQDRQVEQNGREEINDYVDSLYDAAEAELESAQAEYDNLLSDVGEEDLLEARARVVVAYERYQIALDQVDQLRVGEDALEVTLAQLTVEQAEAMVAQAEALLSQAQAGVDQAEQAVSQAEAALKLVQIQVEDLTVTSAAEGVVLARSVEIGELVQPGMTVLTIGQLSELTITVYVSEDQYGQISLGQEAEVSVDSFPDENFGAIVTRIADQAEYTPRNVQTEEDRRTTVFAIELSVEDAEGMLKPGMPADVVFLDK